jgi:probable rRNA maturation factor
MSFLLHTTLKARTPVSKKTGVLWSKLAREVLGEAFDVSVVLIGDQRSHRLNLTYRRKDKPTNVLAFPIADDSGEIYLNVPYSIKESSRYGHAPEEHLSYLFIHGLLHLKGFDHGPVMEAQEKRLLKRLAR